MYSLCIYTLRFAGMETHLCSFIFGYAGPVRSPNGKQAPFRSFETCKFKGLSLLLRSLYYSETKSAQDDIGSLADDFAREMSQFQTLHSRRSNTR